MSEARKLLDELNAKLVVVEVTPEGFPMGEDLSSLDPLLDIVDRLLAMAEDGELTPAERRELTDLIRDELGRRVLRRLYDRLEEIAAGNEEMIRKMRLVIALIRTFG